MAIDEERNRKHALSRRDMLKAVGLSSAGLALAACGAGGTPAAQSGGTAGAATNATAGAVAGETASPEGGAGAGAGATADPNAKPTPTPEPTPTPVVLGTGSQKLTFWHGLGGADGATMVKMLQQYSAQRKDIALRAETYGWDTYYQKLPTATAAGTPPDMAIQHEWSMKQFANQGILQPADELFFQPGLVPKEDFNQSLVKTVTVDGKMMGVPFDNHGWVLYVNKKVIQDAGLNPDQLPKNGTDFIAWAQKVVVDDKGKHPNEQGFNPDRIKVYALHNSWQRFTMPSTIWQFKGAVLSDDAKKSMLASEQTIAAVQYWYDLMYKHHVVPPAIPGQQGAYDYFKGNSLALMWDGSWSLNFFKDNPDVEKLARADTLNSLSPDGTQAAKFGSHMMVVPMGVKDPGLSAAKDLIKWLSDNGETWATSGQVPARLSVQDKPSVQGIWSVKAAANEFKTVGKTEVPHASISEIITTYEAAFSAALANTTPVKQAMQDADKAVQAILDRG
jgi:ABC-type glycerol-3-phosphate transport system substrate-binding protein